MSPAPSPADASAADSAWPRVAQREQDGRQWTVASGRWTTLAMSSKAAWQALADSLKAAPPADDRAWDLRPVEQLDHIGAQLLWDHWRHEWPATIELSPQHKAVLDHVAQHTVATPDEPAPTLSDRIRAFSHNGPRLMYVVRDFTALVGQLALDLCRLARAPHRGPWRDFSGHLYQFGATALHITALVGLLIGVVLAYLISQQLRQYGAETFVVNILGLSLISAIRMPNTESLGRGTTSSVVTSITAVILVDALFAVLFKGIGFRA